MNGWLPMHACSDHDKVCWTFFGRNLVKEDMRYRREFNKGFFWRRGRPGVNDRRWLPANRAIKEYGEKGGSKGWWLKTEDGRVAPQHTIPMGKQWRYIPRGKPPIPGGKK